MAYTKGKISIPNVTGNIVITVTARKKAITNLADPTSAEWLSNHRIRSDGSITTGNSQVTNLIPDAASTSGTPMTVQQRYDSTTGVSTFSITATAYPYARWSIPNTQIADVNAIIITRNEEIPTT